jgi:hypothetical protein
LRLGLALRQFQLGLVDVHPNYLPSRAEEARHIESQTRRRSQFQG